MSHLTAHVLTLLRHNQSEPVSYAFSAERNANVNENPDRWAILLFEELELNQSMSISDFITSLQWYTFSAFANEAPIQGLPFLDLTLYEEVQKLAMEAVRCCGQSHEVYVSCFSEQVDDLIARKGGDTNTAFILSVARKQDYATSDEVAQMQQDSLDAGYCIHGIDPNCCPAGCGEY